MDALLDIFAEHGIVALILGLLGWFTARLVWYVIKESARKVEQIEAKLETAYAQRMETSERLAEAVEAFTVALERLADEQRKLRKAVLEGRADEG